MKPSCDVDMDLRDAIQRITLEWPSYGRPRITAELRRRGWTVRGGEERSHNRRFKAELMSPVLRSPRAGMWYGLYISF